MNLKKGISFTVFMMASFPVTGYFTFKASFFVLLILSAINFFRNKEWPPKLPLFVVLSYFSIDFLSSIVVLSTIESSEILIRKSMFFLLPLTIYFVSNHMDKKTINRILLIFICSTATLSLYVLINLFLMDFSELWNKNSFYHPVFRNNYFDLTKIYFPYLGLYFAFSFVSTIHFIIWATKGRYIKLFTLVSATFIFLFPMLLFSPRAAFLALVFGLAFYVFNISRMKKAIVIITLLSIIFIFVIPNPLKERFEKLTNTEWILPSQEQAPHEVNYRYGVYHCAFQSLKTKFPFGYGLGNVQDQLEECYSSYSYNSFNSFTEQHYNSHNQFLHEILKNGLLGLISICLLFYISFVRAKLIHQTLLIMCIIALLTENFFEREAGIVFFTFFNSIFIFRSKKTPIKWI
tara:strand:+ start:1594 stop:2808 length:1215 start_codon:yes stop_codon:yes gene_type:complete